MLLTATAFTAGNLKIQAIESKHVINRELWVALQFPIGDDVSDLNPLRSSVKNSIHEMAAPGDARKQRLAATIPRGDFNTSANPKPSG
jgi:hypothetical protein